MKTKLSATILASALLIASAGAGWAEPSPDLMNSISRTRSEAAKASASKPIKSKAKHDYAKSSPWAHTRNITAGQSTVAVPDVAHHHNK
ncbi:MAG: hypothetical protein ABS95_02875 [Verrucomicrobia bacterium SCN 57-15]|nr:MAG: hypothetical protein ABS95_02875 [Verrucomicrobia bacterium SCN 57-15]